MDGILTMKGFDTSLAEGVMLLTPFNADSTDERTAAFVKKYQEHVRRSSQPVRRGRL